MTPSRRRFTARWLAVASCVLGAAAGAMGCSVILDWNDLTGGGDGGAGDSAGDFAVDGASPDAKADAPIDGATDDAPAACTGAVQCVPWAPAGWTGPVELFVGTSGAPPSCPAGYLATPAFDGHAGLTAPAPT
ncbi:MAG: hypothetical protein ACRELB_01950, partial [Polyangiaceae bacterium]